MAQPEPPKYLRAFVSKMEKEGLPDIVTETFSHYYKKIVSGESGLISDREIFPVRPEDIAHMEELSGYAEKGEKYLPHAVRIILNGGLGTSMGLTGPKSLLEVRNGLSFLEILLLQSSEYRMELALMNSFSTHAETLSALEKIRPAQMPVCFLQHKFPKILRENLAPALWPADPSLEWNPPGHGDIYTALSTSGLLDQLLAKGICHAFISNSDNLGATTDMALLGYFAERNFPFMMEVAQRTPADVKGGHLARHRNGYLLLRESAQCPEEELDAFRDIERYHFFNTNNLWVNLNFLKNLIQKEKTVRLPMILNPKSLDPRDRESPTVFQVESAMGAAISLFAGAGAVCVPRTRFFPVKKCSDLLLVRSDYFLFTEKRNLILNPHRRSDTLKITLDDRYYGKIDDFDARFPDGVPSLAECESLAIEGDVHFEAGVKLLGDVHIRNLSDRQAVIRKGSTVEGEFFCRLRK
ncbi:MAG: UTP--glucose-1-phosphate uridylyltransferase [Desulfobacterales bacterium]